MSNGIKQPPIASNVSTAPATSEPEGRSLSNRFLTASNLLSVTRALLAIPFVFIMLSSLPSSRLWAAALMILGAITDKLDGVLARKHHEETEWGRIIDPLADKIAVAVVALLLLYLHEIPLWFVALLLVRDVLIFGGGMYLQSKRGIVLGSHDAGKWAFGVVGLTLCVLLLSGESLIVDILVVVSVVLLVVSFVVYVRRFVQVMKGNV